MKKESMKTSIRVGLVSGLGTLILISPMAAAISGSESGASPSPQPKKDSSVSRQEDKAKEAENRIKTADDKFKLCRERKTNIESGIRRIFDGGQKKVDAISKHTANVEAFYQKSGKTLSNYSSLVADINAKKAAAQAAVDKVKADKANFNCDNTAGAQAARATLKADAKTQQDAIKAYKQSVKTLIKAIRTLFASSTAEGTQ